MMQQDLPSSKNMMSATASTSATPMNNNNNNPRKPVVLRPLPSFPSKSKTSSGHGRDDHQVIKLLRDDNVVVLQSGSSSSSSVLVPVRDGNDNVVVEGAAAILHKDSGGRERVKRHREEVAGRVAIPDKWGKEELLKDWMDYSSFDSLLAPNGLASARKALMAEARIRTASQRLRIQSMC